MSAMVDSFTTNAGGAFLTSAAAAATSAAVTPGVMGPVQSASVTSNITYL